MLDRKMEQELGLDFLRVVEAAAIASAHTMGQGDRKYSDHVAVEAMRQIMDTVPMRGEIVIGEGERDEAPMLYIGEKVGFGHKAEPADAASYPEVDIAVDPLEGTNLCATGSANAIAVMACAERGGLLRAPDVYMQKLIVGPSSKGAVDLDAPVKDNLRNIARRLNRDVEDLVVIVLDRPRHKKLIADIREAGARIRLITDGDLSAGISAAVAGSGVHAVMGTGGAPEGVLTAAAMKCLNGQILARFVLKDQLEDIEDRSKIPEGVVDRMKGMGISDPRRIYDTDDLAPGRSIVFAASGVTDGTILRGVRFFGTGTRTNSIIMTTDGKKRVRFVDTVHVEGGPDTVVRF
jgi:fructose-1,6-bisphosphatase class II